MEIPEWVPQEYIASFRTPGTGELLQVTYVIAPEKKQKVDTSLLPEAKQERTEFMNGVLAALKFAAHRGDYKARNKLQFSPIEDVLYELWQVHYTTKHKADPVKFADEIWPKDKDLKKVKYSEWSQMAVIAVMDEAKSLAAENGWNVSGPQSLVKVSRNIIVNSKFNYLARAYRKWEQKQVVEE